MNTTMNSAPHTFVPAAVLQEPKRRGRPLKAGWTVKKCRARIKELGAKPYGKDCAKLDLAGLITYVEGLEAKKAAH